MEQIKCATENFLRRLHTKKDGCKVYRFPVLQKRMKQTNYTETPNFFCAIDQLQTKTNMVLVQMRFGCRNLQEFEFGNVPHFVRRGDFLLILLSSRICFFQVRLRGFRRPPCRTAQNVPFRLYQNFAYLPSFVVENFLHPNDRFFQNLGGIFMQSRVFVLMITRLSHHPRQRFLPLNAGLVLPKPRFLRAQHPGPFAVGPTGTNATCPCNRGVWGRGVVGGANAACPIALSILSKNNRNSIRRRTVRDSIEFCTLFGHSIIMNWKPSVAILYETTAFLLVKQ